MGSTRGALADRVTAGGWRLPDGEDPVGALWAAGTIGREHHVDDVARAHALVRQLGRVGDVHRDELAEPEVTYEDLEGSGFLDRGRRGVGDGDLEQLVAACPPRGPRGSLDAT